MIRLKVLKWVSLLGFFIVLDLDLELKPLAFALLVKSLLTTLGVLIFYVNVVSTRNAWYSCWVEINWRAIAVKHTNWSDDVLSEHRMQWCVIERWFFDSLLAITCQHVSISQVWLWAHCQYCQSIWLDFHDRLLRHAARYWWQRSPGVQHMRSQNTPTELFSLQWIKLSKRSYYQYLWFLFNYSGVTQG